MSQTEDLTVNVKRPDHEIKVEIRLDAVYIYEEIIPDLEDYQWVLEAKLYLC